MTDPTLWHDLALAFEQLAFQYGDRLRLSWTSTPRNDAGDHWLVLGPNVDDADRERNRFNTLAKRAGVHLGVGAQVNLLFAWLDHLRIKSANFVAGHAEGQVGEFQFGWIEQPCRASAECCLDLETDAMNRQETLSAGDASPSTIEGRPSTTPEPALEQARPQRKKRGRPAEIPDQLKEKALQVTGGKERAKILYQTRYPTVQQVKNVPTILKHFNRKRQPKAE